MKHFTLTFNQEELLLTLEALRNYNGHGLTKRQHIADAIEEQINDRQQVRTQLEIEALRSLIESMKNIAIQSNFSGPKEFRIPEELKTEVLTFIDNTYEGHHVGLDYLLGKLNALVPEEDT